MRDTVIFSNLRSHIVNQKHDINAIILKEIVDTVVNKTNIGPQVWSPPEKPSNN